jgi:nitric oxide synthase-interacting protein
MLTDVLLGLVMKPCGHVACKTCTDTLVRLSGQCVACDHQLNMKDILELRREGIQIVHDH